VTKQNILITGTLGMGRLGLGILGGVLLAVVLGACPQDSEKVEVKVGVVAPTPTELETKVPPQRLSVSLSPNSATLSPLNPSATFSFSASGFANNTEASKVELETETIGSMDGLKLATLSSVVGDSRNFEVIVKYDDTVAFFEGSTDIRLHLKNIPQDSTGETQTIHLVVRDGLEKNRAIPINQANIQAFNAYASTTGLGRHYQLTENVSLPSPPANESNWTPIGTTSAAFTGSLNGNNFALSGLIIRAQGYGGYLGLFGYTSASAVIENLGLKGSSLEGGYAGGVVGWNKGMVRSCYNTGTISRSREAGGVVGWNEGTVENCHATGDVYGNSSVAGGVVGWNEGTVESCYATGHVYDNDSVAGGVVGYNASTGVIRGCHATGNIRSNSTSGGVVGRNDGTVQNGYATGDIGGQNYAGGVVGQNAGAVQFCYATGEANSLLAAGGVVGWNESGGLVQYCYATGNVFSQYGASGGVVGRNDGNGGGPNNGRVHNCYATGNVSSDAQNGGGVVGYNAGSVRSSYATGSVRGQRAAGGVVGLNEGGQIYNCVALNPSVSSATTSTSDIGRIMGGSNAINAGSVSPNNRARGSMHIHYDTDSGGTPKTTLNSPYSADGEDLSEEAALSSDFWMTMHWDYTFWGMTTGNLPILKNMGGIQNPRLQ